MIAILLSLPIVGMLAWIGRAHWIQLYEADVPAAERRFLLWTTKGLAVPIIFWILINSGLAPGIPMMNSRPHGLLAALHRRRTVPSPPLPKW